jgi:hypothetical protein
MVRPPDPASPYPGYLAQPSHAVKANANALLQDLTPLLLLYCGPPLLFESGDELLYAAFVFASVAYKDVGH